MSMDEGPEENEPADPFDDDVCDGDGELPSDRMATFSYRLLEFPFSSSTTFTVGDGAAAAVDVVAL